MRSLEGSTTGAYGAKRSFRSQGFRCSRRSAHHEWPALFCGTHCFCPANDVEAETPTAVATHVASLHDNAANLTHHAVNFTELDPVNLSEERFDASLITPPSSHSARSRRAEPTAEVSSPGFDTSSHASSDGTGRTKRAFRNIASSAQPISAVRDEPGEPAPHHPFHPGRPGSCRAARDGAERMAELRKRTSRCSSREAQENEQRPESLDLFAAPTDNLLELDSDPQEASPDFKLDTGIMMAAAASPVVNSPVLNPIVESAIADFTPAGEAPQAMMMDTALLDETGIATVASETVASQAVVTEIVASETAALDATTPLS